MSLRWKPKQEEVPKIAYLLTVLALELNPDILQQDTLEFFEDLLYAEKELSAEDFREAARNLNRKRFDPDYDWWQ